MKNLFNFLILILFSFIFVSCSSKPYSPTKHKSPKNNVSINIKDSTLDIRASFSAFEEKWTDYTFGKCVKSRNNNSERKSALALIIKVNNKEQKLLYKCPNNIVNDGISYDFIFEYIPKTPQKINLAQVLLALKEKPKKDIIIEIELLFYPYWELNKKVKKHNSVVNYKQKLIIKKQYLDSLYIPHWYINKAIKKYKKTKKFNDSINIMRDFKKIKIPKHINYSFSKNYAYKYLQSDYKGISSEYDFLSPYFFPINYTLNGENIFFYLSKKGVNGFNTLTWFKAEMGVDRKVTDKNGNTYVHNNIHLLSYKKIKEFSDRFYFNLLCSNPNLEGKGCLDKLVDKGKTSIVIKLIKAGYEKKLGLLYYKKSDLTSSLKRKLNSKYYNSVIYDLGRIQEIIEYLNVDASKLFSFECKYKEGKRTYTSKSCIKARDKLKNRLVYDRKILKESFNKKLKKAKKSFGEYENLNYQTDIKASYRFNDISKNKVRNIFPYLNTNLQEIVNNQNNIHKALNKKEAKRNFNSFIKNINKTNSHRKWINSKFSKIYKRSTNIVKNEVIKRRNTNKKISKTYNKKASTYKKQNSINNIKKKIADKKEQCLSSSGFLWLIDKNICVSKNELLIKSCSKYKGSFQNNRCYVNGKYYTAISSSKKINSDYKFFPILNNNSKDRQKLYRINEARALCWNKKNLGTLRWFCAGVHGKSLVSYSSENAALKTVACEKPRKKYHNISFLGKDNKKIKYDKAFIYACGKPYRDYDKRLDSLYKIKYPADIVFITYKCTSKVLSHNYKECK